MTQIDYIIGDENQLKQMHKVPAWKPFDERIICFCDELSKKLMKEENYLVYPDLVTLAFWLRGSNIRKIRQSYDDLGNHLGKGYVFHIAPGNVALSFAYSLITGLLTGNANIIRLPSRHFEQANIFCEALRKVLAGKSELTERLCLIRYPHDQAITDKLSLKCHARIIWGGDTTINAIRKSPIPPRATEITFANRFSACLIDADKYIEDFDPKKIAHSFYIDTYLSDQNACSSPRIVCWLGRKITEAKKIFWESLDEEIRSYQMEPVTTADKMLTFCKFAAENECRLMTGLDYKIMRIQVDRLSQEILDNIGNSGYFYECNISDVKDILPICTWEFQTLSYIGFDGNDLRRIVLSNAPEGVDRIVPVGKTMDFNFIWDGRDIVRDLTREISAS